MGELLSLPPLSILPNGQISHISHSPHPSNRRQTQWTLSSSCPASTPSAQERRPPCRPSPYLSRGSPIFPVAPSLVKSLMEADLEEYGPPNPLATPPLRQEIFSKCPPPASPQPASPSPPSPTISMMTESSLPLRKRRLALSESSESSSDSSVSAKDERHALSPTNRGSVIMFAARS